MFSTKSAGFHKCEDCPSSHELIEYQNGVLLDERERDICLHLALCDFCSAEAEFYSCFGEEDNASDIEEAAQIPGPLFELAEALLKKHHTQSDSLNALLNGKVAIDPI